ncbi:hypothetical protein MPY17_01580 [Rhodococcus opacus]|uniref:hypothetical protein n=1 Tax=Rhodococcus opacus TaxID=37919 RepID=UPI001FF6DD10|nr:hypothetical protein [Rhodococcus opacus]UOT04487.1 hypothetical protein MPY17_01580 [Rhodococcus opacus]
MGSFLKDQANDEEFRIRQGLEKVGLFFELNLDEDELRRCQELFGRIAVHDLRVDDSTLLIKHYPALTLATLVGHAGLAYEQGRYWESFWDDLSLERDSDFENALRHSLADVLRKFGLRDFPEFRGRNYVMAMAMHAGIPVRCLSDLIETIEGHVRQGRDATGAALLEWMTAPGMDYRLNRLDVPVRNFLKYGGEIAVDILDRIIEFLAFTLEKPEVWNNLELDTSTTGLPTVLLNGLIEYLHERPFLSTGDGTAAPRGIRQRRTPVISYSVQDDEVLVGVPYPDVEAAAPWKLTVAGSTRDVYAESGWGVEDGEHPATPVAVTAPAREVLLVHEASGASHTVPVFDSADPMLLFTLDGKLLRRTAALPRGLVLAMHPKDAQVVDAVTDEPVRSADDPCVPSGWAGWRVETLDLTGHDSILLRRSGRADGPVRGVRSLGSPSFVPADPVSGLHTPNGLRVYAERPSVDLPPYVGSEPVLWRVRARRSGDRKWLVDCEWESATEETTLDPFDGADAGLLGLYEVEVTCEGGADLRATLFLAEGIGVDHDSTFRRSVPGGLGASVSAITSEHGLTVDTSRLSFGVTDREREIRVGSGNRAQKLVVRPPYAEARIDKLGAPAQWRTSPHAVSPRDLEEHAVIAVRVPGAIRATFALVDERDRTAQQESPERPSDNVFQVSTRRFVDTARRLGVCSLVAMVQDVAGATHRIPVADVRPARLCEQVHVDGADLVFERLADIDDPAVWVWAATAPWRPVTRLAISGVRATIPEPLRGAGDLIAMVFADDPFTVVTRPSRPDRDALRVTQSGWVRDDNPELDGLARFLSGVGEPPLVPEAAGGAWAALALLAWDASDPASERLRGGLMRILGRHPRAALEALGSSTIPQDQMMPLLIRTQLVDRPYSSRNTLNDLHPNAWVGCMVEISDLPSLRDRGRAVAGERAETLAYLETQGGRDLMDLLRAGKMSDPRSGVFDANVLKVHGMDQEQVEELFERFRLVPGALLDIDTRVSATVDAFHRRADWVLEPACRDLPGHVTRALRSVKKASPALYDLVVARNEVLYGVDTVAHPWMLLSMQSLALAAVARLEALGEFEYPIMTTDMRDAWALMAQYFPAMVAGDLLIAEALAAHLTHGDLIGDTA